MLLDRERCVLCQRCTRFSEQIAGDPFIELLERGAQQQIGVAEDKPFQSYFSGNTIQICPVGALTSAAYRFRSRPFDLVSTPSVCEHCACGSAMRTDTRRGVVLRRLAGNDPAVNEEWIGDKSRFAFRYLTSPTGSPGRWSARPDGTLAETSWTEALSVAARGLLAAREGGIGVLAGGRLTVEDAYAYAKFARVAAGTNDVDFRARPHSAEELEFLAAHVVGQGPEIARLHAPRGRVHGALRGAGAGGGGADRLPAPPQGGAQARPERLPPRAVDHARRGAHVAVHRRGGARRPRTTSSRSCPGPRPRCSATCPRPCSSGSPAAA